MSELALHAALFGLGLLYTLPAHRTVGVSFACAAAFPLGLVLWVSVALAMLVAPVPFSRAGAVGGLLVVFAVGLVRAVRSLRGGPPPPLAAVALSSAAFGVAAAAFAASDLTILTLDSHYYIGTGRSLAAFGDLGAIEPQLTNIGVFQVLVQSAGGLVDAPYLHASTPLLATSTLACFVVLAQRGLVAPGRVPAPAERRRAVAIASLAAAATATPYFALVSGLYVHTNGAAACYLLLFCATFWTAETTRSTVWLPYAFAFLLAFSLQRLELPVFAVLFAVLACSETSLAGRCVDRWLGAFAVVVALWYAYLATAVGTETRLLTRDRSVAVIALVTATPVVVRMLRARGAASFRRWIPRLAVALPVVGIAVAFAARPEQMSRSSAAMLAHLTDPVWGATWAAVPVFGVAAALARPIPLQRLFSHGCAATVVLIVLAGVLRAGYHDRLTDSGNRMLMHVVPTLYFFFAVSLGRTPSARSSERAPGDGRGDRRVPS